MKKDIESAPKLDSIEPNFQEEDAALDDQDVDEDMEDSGESGSEGDESPFISFAPNPKGPLELNFEEEVIVIKGDPADDVRTLFLQVLIDSLTRIFLSILAGGCCFASRRRSSTC